MKTYEDPVSGDKSEVLCCLVLPGLGMRPFDHLPGLHPQQLSFKFNRWVMFSMIVLTFVPIMRSGSNLGGGRFQRPGLHSQASNAPRHSPFSTYFFILCPHFGRAGPEGAAGIRSERLLFRIFSVPLAGPVFPLATPLSGPSCYFSIQ